MVKLDPVAMATIARRVSCAGEAIFLGIFIINYYIGGKCTLL